MAKASKTPVKTDIGDTYEPLVCQGYTPAMAVDEPHSVVRLVVVDALRDYERHHGRLPNYIHIPVAVEAALQIDLGRSMQHHCHLRAASCVPTQVVRLYSCMGCS